MAGFRCRATAVCRSMGRIAPNDEHKIVCSAELLRHSSNFNRCQVRRLTIEWLALADLFFVTSIVGLANWLVLVNLAGSQDGGSHEFGLARRPFRGGGTKDSGYNHAGKQIYFDLPGWEGSPCLPPSVIRLELSKQSMSA